MLRGRLSSISFYWTESRHITSHCIGSTLSKCLFFVFFVYLGLICTCSRVQTRVEEFRPVFLTKSLGLNKFGDSTSYPRLKDHASNEQSMVRRCNPRSTFQLSYLNANFLSISLATATAFIPLEDIVCSTAEAVARVAYGASVGSLQ